jgi:hypothetical protein
LDKLLPHGGILTQKAENAKEEFLGWGGAIWLSGVVREFVQETVCKQEA